MYDHVEELKEEMKKYGLSVDDHDAMDQLIREAKMTEEERLAYYDAVDSMIRWICDFERKP